MQRELRLLLYRDLLAFAAGRGTGGADLLVDFPNVDAQLDVPIGELIDAADQYLRVTPLPTPPQVLGVTNGWARHRVLFQIDVLVEAGADELPALDHVDALATHYPVGRRLVGATSTWTVMQAPYPARGEPSDGWYVVPTTMRLDAFV